MTITPDAKETIDAMLLTIYESQTYYEKPYGVEDNGCLVIYTRSNEALRFHPDDLIYALCSALGIEYREAKS